MLNRQSGARPRHMLLGGGLVLAALMSSTTNASADGWGTVDCGQAPTPQCQIEVGAHTSPPKSTDVGPANHEGTGGTGDASGGSDMGTCGYQPSEAPGGAIGSGLVPSDWHEGLCSASGAVTNPGPVAAPTPAAIAKLARDQLGLPTPKIAASPRTDQLVNLPTWLWLEGGWDRVRAVASVPGISITALALPRSVTWSMGDGGAGESGTVVCAGIGTRFSLGMDPRSSSPDCGYTYRRSSAGQPGDAFTVSATVHWSVRWSGAGQSGTFPDLTTTSSTRFRVAESQALNVPPAR